MSFGNRQPPGIHIPRRELGEPNLTEHPRRLAKEPAQLRKRHLLRLMHPEVLVDELGKRDRRRSTTGPEPLNHLPKRLLRFGPGREPADLRPRRAAMPFGPIPIRPQRLTVHALRLPT